MINSQRLHLRDTMEFDLDALHTLYTNKDVMQYIPLTLSSKDHVKILLQKIADDINSDERKMYLLVIKEKDSENIIGTVNLKVESKQKDEGIAVIGYTLFKEFWGCGYATEATMAIIEFGFSNLNLHRIEASSIVDNTASKKVLLKSNFRHEGTKRKSLNVDGVWFDEDQYGILRDDFIMVKHGWERIPTEEEL